MSTLYRDYRPQTFSEIFGQNHIKITLQNEIESNKVSQAYLFCGPRAVGKTTLARVLAKAVNCTTRKDGEHEPCNKCDNCKTIVAGNNLDVIEIDAASNTGIDNVRENIIAFSRLRPHHSKYKVFIIDEVHMLSISSFNALLKTIEEPPKYVIFILCTTEVHKVPNTIISRCERFDFQRISVNDIVNKLTYISQQEKVDIDKEVLEAIARRSGGHLRDAESMLGQIFSLGDKKITLEQAELLIPHHNNEEAVELLGLLSNKDASRAIVLVNDLINNGVNIKDFIGEIITLLRKIMLNKLNPTLNESLGLNLGENLEMKINDLSNNLDWEKIILFINKFIEVNNRIKDSFIVQLPLEIVIAEICFDVHNNYTVDDKNVNLPIDKKIKMSTKKKIEDGDNTEKDEHQFIEKGFVNLSQAQVLEKWPEFLVKIKKYNHSLSFVLQNCQPQNIKDGKLYLEFKYKFHQDRINNPEIKVIVERGLGEVFGSGITVISEINEDLRLNDNTRDVEVKEDDNKKIVDSSPEKNSSNIGDLLKTFGGEIIN